MSNFFDTVRSLQESNWAQYAPQLSRTAHDASRVARDPQSHKDAATEHDHAAFSHGKAAAELPADSFAHQYHSQMAAHHGAMNKLHSTHAGVKEEVVAEESLDEKAVDAKGYKSDTGGLTQKGRDHYNRETGGNLKAPVTKKPSELDPKGKAAGRRRSFCARMSGVKGPMKKPNGEPTRKALALKKWNC